MNSRTRFARGALLALAALTITACANGDREPLEAPPAESAPFYAGKTIELVVPSAAGTGNDTTARWLAPLISQYVSGHPRVQVINVEGAGGITAANDFAQRNRDGLTWYLSGEANTASYLLGGDGVAYDYADWAPVIGFPSGTVVYSRPGAAGVQGREQLLATSSSLILGGEQNAGTTGRALTLDLLGVDYKLVTGYGGNRAEIALQQGEIDVSGASTIEYLELTAPLVAQGDVVALYSQGYRDGDESFERDPAVPDLPHLAELYEDLHGSPPVGETWDAFQLLFDSTRSLTKVVWLQADAPSEALDAAHEGIEAIVEDPAFGEEVSGFLGGYVPLTGDTLAQKVAAISDPDPATLAWLKEYADRLYQ